MTLRLIMMCVTLGICEAALDSVMSEVPKPSQTLRKRIEKSKLRAQERSKQAVKSSGDTMDSSFQGLHLAL